MPIDALPAAPSPTDSRADFKLKSFAHVAALAAWTTQANALAATVTDLEASTESHAAAAELARLGADAAADLAGAAAGATKWISGAAYTEGAVAWSPTDFLNYRRKTAGSSATDPSADPANWVPAMSVAAGDKGAADLNALTTPGMYTFAGASNAPAGASSGTLFVARSGGTLGQIVVGPSGFVHSRSATGIGTSPAWTAWRRSAAITDNAIALAGGDADCSLGNYFTETVAGTRTLSFVNVPSGPYSCIVEINHTSGTFTLPAGTVYANSSAPTFAAGKRHLLFFQRAQLGTAGWYVSALPNFAP